MLKVSTQTELELKVSILEQQLQESRKQADNLMEQRNQLAIEKIELQSAQANQKEMFRRQMDLVKTTVQQDFPRYSASLYSSPISRAACVQ